MKKYIVFATVLYFLMISFFGCSEGDKRIATARAFREKFKNPIFLQQAQGYQRWMASCLIEGKILFLKLRAENNELSLTIKKDDEVVEVFYDSNQIDDHVDKYQRGSEEPVDLKRFEDDYRWELEKRYFDYLEEATKNLDIQIREYLYLKTKKEKKVRPEK